MKHYDNIQFWRVFAVMGVYICHLFQHLMDSGALIRRITDYGSLCVELFFIISGFLAIKHFDPDYTHTHTLGKYYKTRAVRILPLYYVVILYFFITETFVFRDVPLDPSGLYWLRYIVVFLYGNVRSANSYFDFWTNLGATWSICVFATFYLFAPLFAKLIRSFWQACISVLCFWAIHAYIAWKSPPFFHTTYYFIFFMLGILIWFAHKEQKEEKACIFAGLLLLLNIILNRTALEFNQLMMSGIAFTLLVTSTMNWHYRNEQLKVLIQIIDKYSYTIYLAQGIVFIGIIDKVPHMKVWITASIGIFGTVVLSYVVYNFVELPIQKILSKRQ